MINLSKAKIITSTTTRKKNSDNFDVRIAIYNKKEKLNAVCFTFYEKKHVSYFKGHGIVIYLSDNKVIFVIDDEHGYTFSSKSSENCGIVKSTNKELLLFCINSVGKYNLKYDYDSKVYYIDLKNRLED